MVIIIIICDGEEMESTFFKLAVLFSFVGFYYALKAFLSFRNTSDELLRAKVFLTKNFLHNNFVFIFIVGSIVGSLVFIHTILELLKYEFADLSMPFAPILNIIYVTTLPVATLLMAFLAYHWNCALFQKNEIYKDEEPIPSKPHPSAHWQIRFPVTGLGDTTQGKRGI